MHGDDQWAENQDECQIHTAETRGLHNSISALEAYWGLRSEASFRDALRSNLVETLI